MNSEIIINGWLIHSKWYWILATAANPEINFYKLQQNFRHPPFKHAYGLRISVKYKV